MAQLCSNHRGAGNSLDVLIYKIDEISTKYIYILSLHLEDEDVIGMRVSDRRNSLVRATCKLNICQLVRLLQSTIPRCRNVCVCLCMFVSVCVFVSLFMCVSCVEDLEIPLDPRRGDTLSVHVREQHIRTQLC